MKGFGVPKGEQKNTIKEYTNAQEGLLRNALQLHSQGDLEGAANYYQDFLDKGFKDPRVFSNYGVICKQINQIDKAIDLFKQSINLFPNNASSYYNLGNILKEIGNIDKAEYYTRKAIELKPDYALAYSNLSWILRDLGDLEKAENAARVAIKLKPNFAGAYNNLGSILCDIGDLKNAKKTLQKAIEIDPNLALAHLNLGGIFKELGELKRAESSIREAIRIKPDISEAYSNLGSILISIGRLKEAEESILKALELNPSLAKAYFNLSTLKLSPNNDILEKNIFSKDLIMGKSNQEKIDIYFAISNILHNRGEYLESSKYLELGNKLKLSIHPSDAHLLISKSKHLLNECDKYISSNNEDFLPVKYIFIVGMPRSGSTLIESIISMNDSVDDLGEVNILEQSFLLWKEKVRTNNQPSLLNEYTNKVKDIKGRSLLSTNKFLYNYQYSGVIASKIDSAKIVHCQRHPLDNILSIYRSQFSRGNYYSSSLSDCAKVYLDHEDVMSTYKSRYSSKIYNCNYDQLVQNPTVKIKSLIKWLGWEWSDAYLSPHLNARAIQTASSVQVRSPINAKSVGGWKNYREMLQPAINILQESEKYKNLLYL